MLAPEQEDHLLPGITRVWVGVRAARMRGDLVKGMSKVSQGVCRGYDVGYVVGHMGCVGGSPGSPSPCRGYRHRL